MQAVPYSFENYEIWDYTAGKLRRQQHQELSSIAIGRAQDGYFIATGNCSGEITFWDARSGYQLRTHPAHEGCISNMAFNADGRYMVTRGEDKKVSLWDTTSPGADPLLTYSHPEGVLDVALSYDGDTVASISKFELHVWSTVSGNNIQTNR
jgi:WD40 repeat protein